MKAGPQKQIEELLHRMEAAAGSEFERGPGTPKAKQPAGHHPGERYFELAERMFRTVRREVLLVGGQMNGFCQSDIERFRGRVAALCERSVVVSLICHPDVLDGHGRQEFFERIVREGGARVRVSGVRLQGTFVFDRRCALTWDPRSGGECAVVRSPVIVEPLLKLTDAVWEGACDLEAFVQWQGGLLDEKTPEVLRLLGSGRKDEVAARELGVSVRTYRRHVAGLMEMLGAESRFEAGVKAAALGLVRAGVQHGHGSGVLALRRTMSAVRRPVPCTGG